MAQLHPSLRAEGEAIHEACRDSGLRRYARNDAGRLSGDEIWAKIEALSPAGLRTNMEYAERVSKRLAKDKKAKAI